MTTIQDTLTEDLVAYWAANRPADLPLAWSIYHVAREGLREVPYIVVGDTGCERVPGQPDTGKVALRVMPVSPLDNFSAEEHRRVAGIMDAAVAALLEAEDPLSRAWIHDLLREEPDHGTDKETRHQWTELKWSAVVSRTRAEV